MTAQELKQHLLENRGDKQAKRELQLRPKKDGFAISAETSAEDCKQIIKNEIPKFS